MKRNVPLRKKQRIHVESSIRVGSAGDLGFQQANRGAARTE